MWSFNRQQMPQGVYSHQTALRLYDLSDVNALAIRISVCSAFWRLSEHSQIRKTFHPAARSNRDTVRSRFLLQASFALQNRTRLFGILAWRGQPCQKQPSTNTATFRMGKIKSGFPGKRAPRRQPMMCRARIKAMSRSSVELFPRARTRDIRSERCANVSVSATASLLRDIFGSVRLFPPGFDRRSACLACCLHFWPMVIYRVNASSIKHLFD